MIGGLSSNFPKDGPIWKDIPNKVPYLDYLPDYYLLSVFSHILYIYYN
jgi:hypothetical protein